MNLWEVLGLIATLLIVLLSMVSSQNTSVDTGCVISVFFLAMMIANLSIAFAGLQCDNHGNCHGFRKYLILSFWEVEVIVYFFKYCKAIEMLVNSTVFPSSHHVPFNTIFRVIIILVVSRRFK